MRHYFTIASFLFLQVSYAQDNNNLGVTTIPVDLSATVTHDSAIYYLQTGDQVVCGFVGRSSQRVVNFSYFLRYAYRSPVDTLKYYLDNRFNLSLRLYSVWALLLRKTDSLEYMIDDLLKDTRTVRFSCGCIISQDFTVNEFIYLLFSGKIDLAIDDVSSKRLRYIKKAYGPGESKVMQPYHSGPAPALKAF